MSYQTPTIEPLKIIAGETIQWSRSFSEFPATEGWVLSYTLLNSSQKITFQATTYNGTDFLVSEDDVTTTQWSAGTYKWQAQVSDGTSTFTVGSGTMEIVQGFADATGPTETRSQAKITLDNIEAYLNNSNNLNAASYTIAGRTLSRIPIPDLLKLRDRYRIDVANEEVADRIARGLPNRQQVRVRL